ncbi:hypothetical protein PVAP13_1NG513319 [Panicum virgatum]|uniref:Uncharacterized protein n=1 Tax=Panicum virgatum TaxID=38727 RepID=A0A8T0XGN1_PANVG|nr:hypothetical protein PVAP13_1NG513319 [Panicum virgatum]
MACLPGGRAWVPHGIGICGHHRREPLSISLYTKIVKVSCSLFSLGGVSMDVILSATRCPECLLLVYQQIITQTHIIELQQGQKLPGLIARAPNRLFDGCVIVIFRPGNSRKETQKLARIRTTWMKNHWSRPVIDRYVYINRLTGDTPIFSCP